MMMYDYDNPNTCYAIGDCFSVYIGTAATNRQPSAGVFEQLSCLIKQSLTDTMSIYDGSTTLPIMAAATRTANNDADSNSFKGTFNMALLYGNTVYLRKPGTTDFHGISGVQVDA